MPVHEFRSKRYDESTWHLIWKHIKDDLKQEELTAFAPKARVVQAETQSLPVVPFPLMKLPLELRILVYKMHFSQPAEPHRPLGPQQELPAMCYQDKLPFGRCPFRTFNGGIPVRQLWTLSKDLYHEAMPIYFQTTEFKFSSFGGLGRFLSMIGPYHRQHVTRVILNTCLFDSSVDSEDFLTAVGKNTGLKALKLLRGCEALRHMKIIMLPSQNHMAETSELFRAILKIRNLRSLDVYDYWSRWDLYAHLFLEFHEYNKQALQVLKRPRRAADVEEREKKGTFSVAIPRTFFGSINKPVVGDWFDVRESEAMKESSENDASECTELKYLERERKLVEASFDSFEDQ